MFLSLRNFLGVSFLIIFRMDALSSSTETCFPFNFLPNPLLSKDFNKMTLPGSCTYLLVTILEIVD